MLQRKGHEEDSSGDEETEPMADNNNEDSSSEPGPSGINDNSDPLGNESEEDSFDSSLESEESECEQKREEEDDDEDPVIKAIRAAREVKIADKPPDLKLNAIPSTISFHPTEDLITICDYDGSIELYSYSTEENKPLYSKKPFGNSDVIVREVIYALEDNKLVTAFNNQDLIIYDVETLKPTRVVEQATPAPVSCMYAIDENTFATGDDDGYVQIWDVRSKTDATCRKISEDAITSMISNDDKKILVCSSAEGAIYSLKIRGGGKVQTESEIYDYEFNTLGLFKHDTKVAAGNGNGEIYVFNWDEFGKHSDIYCGPGKGSAINCLISLTEKVVITGGDDGILRAVNFFPHRYLGIVGRVKYPIDKMDVCNDGHLIATIGADETVKFWNVSYFETFVVPSETASRGKNKVKVNRRKGEDGSRNNLPSSNQQNTAEFFKGLTE